MKTMHGLRYTGLIADGDSSVHRSIIDSVPIYGRRVKKIECANHIFPRKYISEYFLVSSIASYFLFAELA